MKQPSDPVAETLAYYDRNAKAFLARTVDADLSALYEPFLRRLPKGAAILDLGCGSGRDTKAFLDLGYAVTALDGSEAMVDATTQLAGVQAVQARFQEITFDREFDGIWACASLLHVPRPELGDILEAVTRALKPDGTAYLSFKEGEGEVVSDGRLYTYFTPTALSSLLEVVEGVEILEVWTSEELRPQAKRITWVNVLFSRK